MRWYLKIWSQKQISSIFIWKNHSTKKNWMTILVFCRFLNQIRLQKTVFWTNMEWIVFFNQIFIWKNHSTHCFWITFLVFCRFLNQIRLKKTVFWTNMEWNVFFNPILKYFTIYKNFFLQHVRFVVLKINKWLQKHFSWMRLKNNKTFCKKKVFVCSQCQK